MKFEKLRAMVTDIKSSRVEGRQVATLRVVMVVDEGTPEGAVFRDLLPEIVALRRIAIDRAFKEDAKDRLELVLDRKRLGAPALTLKLWALPPEARREECTPKLDGECTVAKKVQVSVSADGTKIRFGLMVGAGDLPERTADFFALVDAEAWLDVDELQMTLEEQEAAERKKDRKKKGEDAQLPLAPSTAGATGFGALAEPRKRVERDVAPAESAPQEPPPETRVCVVAPDVDLGFDPVGMSGPELAHDLLEETRDELVAIAQVLGLPHDGGHGAMALVIAARLCVAPHICADAIPWESAPEANAATPATPATTATDPATTKRHARALMLLAAHPSHLHVSTHAMESDVEDTLAPLPDADVLGYFLLIAGRQPTEAEGASLRAEVARLICGGAVAPVEPATAKPGVTVAASAEAPPAVPSVVPDLPVDLSLGFDPTMLTLEELEVEVTALSSDKLRVVHRQLTGSVPKGKAEETVKTVLGRLRMHARRDSASASA